MRFAMSKQDRNVLQKMGMISNWKRAVYRYLFVLIQLSLLVCGCSSVADLSRVKPYSRYVGKSFCLNCECELWNKCRLFPFYEIVFEPYDGYPDEWLVKKLPKGTVITIESIKRESGNTILGHFSFREEYARVRLDDPNHPKSRIHASISLTVLEQICWEKK